MHISERAKHRLMLGGAAVIVLITAYVIWAKENGIDLGVADPNAKLLKGFGLKGSGGGRGGYGAGGLPTGNGGNLPAPPDGGGDITFTPVPEVTPLATSTFETQPSIFSTLVSTISNAVAGAFDTPGFSYTADPTQTPGGPGIGDGNGPAPAGLNTFTVTVNDTGASYADGTPMVAATGPRGQNVFTGPTGYQDITGEQVYQTQYLYEGPSTNYNVVAADPETAPPSNRIAYVPDTGAPIYQQTPYGWMALDPGTQLPIGHPDDPYQQFQGYGLINIGGQTDNNGNVLPENTQGIAALANSLGPDNWVGSQGHNPNNPYDTN